jgi:CelD/BcsL family acetyltransferase involved in cellulose biosynthesis
MLVSLITTPAHLADIQPEWTRLFYLSATPNPFAHPLWMTAWARHFIQPSQLFCLTVRGDDGALIGVAPFYRWRHRLGPWRAATSVHLLGAGHHMGLTELTQVLIQRGMERSVLRAIVQFLCEQAGEWDWVELVLPPEQGWFEPQWLPESGACAGSLVVHKATRPCVLLPLPGSWQELRAGLKRNVKESLRRGVNSLEREGHAWQFAVPCDQKALTPALEELIALHRMRAQARGKVQHANILQDARDREFLFDAGRCMFEAGHLAPAILRVNGEVVAARLLLRANGSVFFSLSGFDVRWWPYNVATTLVAECLRHAIERGDRVANLSPGVDAAKLRWSEQLSLHQEFLVVGPRRRSRLAFSLFWQARAADLLRRESRHRRRG